ncbi:peptidylprolyl isomerase [Rapidithrix thailandica]|uniref:Peptidyl-prolyl cis-trans isomerase n=1 Tax=Rapidithrix thailandica TaxID=413964 RepID=A0AAW9S8S0_9BACT
MYRTPQKIVMLIAFLLAFTVQSFGQKSKKKDFLVSIETKFGTIQLVLFDQAPNHKTNFLKLVDEGFYDSTTFHRVLDDFMIQGGDPNTKPEGNGKEIGMGGPGYTLPAEIDKQYTHVKGMVAAARQGDRINPERHSSGSQFYIVQNENGAHHLDGKYTIFGQVIKGLEVVDSIASQEVDAKGKPLEEVYITVGAKKMKKKKITKLTGYKYQ